MPTTQTYDDFTVKFYVCLAYESLTLWDIVLKLKQNKGDGM